ncbi:PREDICTED: ATP-dependent RNA helicase DDX24-like, partial [Apaloderma vittatum]|uniref:ATP-dependent RNA helicase DDX24-like n=1 Tax=Apaloderma vittatum TaxID=57397 RepID=UPI000521936F
MKTNKGGRFRSSFKLKKKGIKVTGKWKTVEIDPSLFADEDFGDIVCLEELTDYKLVSSSKLGEVKEKKRKADSVSDEDSEEQAPVVSPKKKKKTKGLRSKTDTSNEPCAAEIDVSVDKEANCKDRGHVAETTSSKKDAPKKKKIAKNKASQAQEALPSVPTSKKVKNWTTEVLSASANHKADVSAWKDLFVPEPVLRALSYLGFSAPTPIQALALPSAIRDNMDVLGAAETGSGKTLAFAIPMIHSVLQWQKLNSSTARNDSVSEESHQHHDETRWENEDEAEKLNHQHVEDSGDEDDTSFTTGSAKVFENFEFNSSDKACTVGFNKKRPLLGLVLTPTRELAVQVKHHIDAVAKFT